MIHNLTSKNDFRKIVMERRGQAAPSDIENDSNIIFRKIAQSNEYIMSSAIYIYVDHKNEVRTKDFIAKCWTDGKRVAVPRVKGKDMSFYYIESMRDLEPGIKGIPEPKQDMEKADAADALVIMPGVAFDHERNRIGYGGGYYDRFMKKNPWLYSMAVAFEFQVFDEIPADEHDIKPSVLITEQKIYRKTGKKQY
ncbi:MAG TPA: 5-formyltetrahydrofolate cyclo-ligase [Lachnospiraceae bacterium]|nr:5-formyltetrahydrofolate cyclo-ligase [Lachnospiraceae bacterium]